NYGLHLPGAFTAWKDWNGPKKMVIGPGIYLDRPLYQYQDESLRWFDYWLKGIDTGVMDEPPIRCFIPPTGEWKILNDWPPLEAHWTTFYLHKDEILSEHELWPGEGVDSFDESSFEHGSVTYVTPPLVENTEVLGPSVLTLYESSGASAAASPPRITSATRVSKSSSEAVSTWPSTTATTRSIVRGAAAACPAHRETTATVMRTTLRKKATS